MLSPKVEKPANSSRQGPRAYNRQPASTTAAGLGQSQIVRKDSLMSPLKKQKSTAGNS